MLHPAERDRDGEKIRGVSTQGLGRSAETEPILVLWWCAEGGLFVSNVDRDGDVWFLELRGTKR